MSSNRLITKINDNQKSQDDWNAAQMVNNAQMSSAIAVNSNSIATLQNACSQITKLVVPNSAVCCGWGPVKVVPDTGTTPSTGA